MNLQQLSLVVAVAETGSISRGASRLFLSQSSASGSITALEAELGYALFVRSSTGVQPTDPGRTFILKARGILDQVQELKSPSLSDIPRLRVGVLNYSPTVEAFLNLVPAYSGVRRADLACFNVTIENGLKLLSSKELDILALLRAKNTIRPLDALASSLGLTVTHMCDIPLNINLRQGHPLQNAVENGTFAVSMLSNYPIVSYRVFSNQPEMISSSLPPDLRCSYSITVDERDTRCRIVSSTDAYSIGCPLSDDAIRRYGLISVPLNTSTALYYIIRKREPMRPEMLHYIDLLREEMNKPYAGRK